MGLSSSLRPRVFEGIPQTRHAHHSCIVKAIPLTLVRNSGGGPQDILEVGDSYLSTFDRTQRYNFPIEGHFILPEP